jgi:hypothetical protein
MHGRAPAGCLLGFRCCCMGLHYHLVSVDPPQVLRPAVSKSFNCQLHQHVELIEYSCRSVQLPAHPGAMIAEADSPPYACAQRSSALVPAA